jgi:hypothetical protein
MLLPMLLLPMLLLPMLLLPTTSVTSKTDDGAALPPPTVEAGRAGVARLLRAAAGPLFSQLRACRRAPASAAAPSNAAAGGTTAQPWY